MSERARYEEMVSKGVTPRLADMLASRQAPGVVTDDTFFKGRKNQEDMVSPRYQHYAQKYRKETGNSTAGKTYLSGLARYPGDPEAWVTNRGEIKDVLNRRGWSSDGQVTVKRNRDCLDHEAHEYGLDPKIVTEEVEKIIAEHPELGDTSKKRERLWQETYDRMKPHYTNEKAPEPPEHMRDGTL